MGPRGSSVPLNSVEFFDTKTETWQDSVPLTQTIGQPEAVSFGGKIYLFGGLSGGVFLNHTLEFDPVIGTWTQKSPMPTARAIIPSVVFEDKIWVIGGYNGISLNNVESYDPLADEWTIETPISVTRHFGTAWVEQGKIYYGGGYDSSGVYKNTIERYDPLNKQWTLCGTMPEYLSAADSVTLGDKVYIVAGTAKPLGSGASRSNKVYAADLLSHRDLYFRSVASETVNREPTSVFAVGGLNIFENQSIGTIVGEFNATDPEGGALDLLPGQRGRVHDGSKWNARRHPRQLDYEAGSSCVPLWCRQRMRMNATVEGNFYGNHNQCE